MKKKIAIYAGTFDPVTYGHLNILKRATTMFDEIIMAVSADNYKQTVFTGEERVKLIREAIGDNFTNVRVDMFSGLLIHYVEQQHACAIIRGLRAISDFEYEMQMASINSHLDRRVETIFLMTDNDHSFISSSLIKKVALLGGDVDEFVPPNVAACLRKKYEKRRGNE